MPKRYKPDELVKVLIYDGWARRRGRDDHVNFVKPGRRLLVTIDMGAAEIPKGTMGNILRQMGVSRRRFDGMAREAR
jgi:predicted RNA binding protein YcfA (HicA-like mRNA interferase family)